MADRPLHIAVDGRELLGHRTGVGRYLEELLTAWQADPTWPHRLTVIAPGPPPPAVANRLVGVPWDIERASGAGTWWEQMRLPRSLRRVGADVLFAPAYTGPLRLPCPLVLTIHDLSFFAHPEWFRWREGLRRRWLTRAAAKRAAAVLADSRTGAAEIAERLHVPAGRIHAVPLGAPAPRGPETGRRDPLVLYVGSLFERRHVPELVEAFARIAVADARLVLIGEDRSRGGIDPMSLARRHGIASRVDWHRHVSEPELNDLYGRARVFVFLSEYEGFGLTPLEAMAAGVPPLVLDTPVAREVYGTAARFVALDPGMIAASLQQLLQDDGVHADYAARGRRRTGELSWAATARATRRVIERAVRP